MNTSPYDSLGVEVYYMILGGLYKHIVSELLIDSEHPILIRIDNFFGRPVLRIGVMNMFELDVDLVERIKKKWREPQYEQYILYTFKNPKGYLSVYMDQEIDIRAQNIRKLKIVESIRYVQSAIYEQVRLYKDLIELVY